MRMFRKRFHLILITVVYSLFTYSCTTVDPPKDIIDEEDDGNVESSAYTIHFNIEKQTILGLGIEIQSDRFGPRYEPSDPINGIPYDLIPSERTRLATELASGFRYLRIAMGLWFRGLTDDQKHFVERYPGQLDLIKEMMEQANMEGISLEYWSPAPYWKSTYNLLGGTLRSYDNQFLEEFGDALARDVQYFLDNGVKVSTWGLQNEPFNGDGGYPMCFYTDENYFKTFKAVAPKIRAVSPETEIIVDTKNANFGALGNMIRNDPTMLQYVDSWVYHRSGNASETVIEGAERYLRETLGKPVYQNEWAFNGVQVSTIEEEWRMVDLAQSIMNWMTFVNSPKWYWLHLLKPTNDANRFGFGLGFYRRDDDNNFSQHADIPKGTFKYHWPNYNGIAGFMKYMEWDSKRIHVQEDSIRYDQRIMAWRKPDGKHVFVMTNRSSEKFNFVINLDKERSFVGHRYNRDFVDYQLPAVSGQASYTISLEPYSIEFWTEEDDLSSVMSETSSLFKANRTGNAVSIEGMQIGEIIEIYHLNGQLINRIIADAEKVNVPLTTNDIVLVKTKTQTIKI